MIYILGAGAMARETLGIYGDLGRHEEVGGFIEKDPARLIAEIYDKKVFDTSVIGTLPDNTLFIGAVGSPERRKWIEEIEDMGFKFDTAIHPSVIMGDSVTVGAGCIICPGAILTCDITIGRHSILNIGSTVSHDCAIGDFVTVAPGVNVAGNVTIGDGCLIGVGAKIVNDIRIGKGSCVGAGAVVTKDVPEGMFAAGVPAKRKVRESDLKGLS